MRRTIAAAMLVLVGFGVPTANASSLNFFTSFWVFGDSLSDPGNLYAATGGADSRPSPISRGGCRTGRSGRNTCRRLSTRPGCRTGNYAYMPLPMHWRAAPGRSAPFVKDLSGSSTSSPPNPLGCWAPAARHAAVRRERPVLQRHSLRPGASGRRGGGECGQRRGTVPEVAGGERRDAVHPAAARPDTGLRAAIAPARNRRRSGTEAFNTTLLANISGLEAAGLNVLTIDLFGLFGQLLDNPLDFGVLNATLPCYIPPPAGPGFILGCSLETAPLLAFFDPVHPNNVIHEQIANLVREQVAPVPLPLPALLLIGGIAGLGFVRRRAA
jgi:hypothetical protein